MIQRIKSLIERLKNDDYIKNSVIIFGFSIMIQVMQYVYHIYNNRNLSKDDYGLLNTLFSLSVIIGAIVQILQKWATKCFSEIASYKKYSGIKGVILYFYKYIAVIALVIVGLNFIFIQNLSDTFKSDSLVPFYLFIALVVLNFVKIPFHAFLESFGLFFNSSLSGFVNSVVKLALTAFFILSGFSVYKALGAQILGLFVAFVLFTVFSVWHIRKLNKQNPKHDESGMSISRFADSKNFWFFLKIALPMIFISTFLNMDMPIVRIVFSQSLSGEYATAAVLGKSVYFLTSINMPILFVSANNAFNKGESYSTVLLRGGGILLAMAVPGIIAFFTILKPFVNLFNESYLESIPYIKAYAISMLPLSFINFFTIILMSANKYRIFISLLILNVLQAAALYILPQNGLIDISGVFTLRLIFGLLIFVILLIYLIINRKSFFKSSDKLSEEAHEIEEGAHE